MISLLIWVFAMPMSVMSSTHSSDTLFYRNYPYIFVVEDGKALQPLTDEQFFDVAAKVVFPVGKTELPADSPLLRELETSVIPHINGDSLQLLHMVFRGAASPEGPVTLNERLGRQRVKNLFDWVTSRMTFPVTDSLFIIDADIEDYRSLCLMMSRANDPDYAVVSDLCDRYQGQDLNMLKQQLQDVQQGRLWRRLLTTYFPYLRTARFVIYLRKVTSSALPVPVVVPVDTVVAELPATTVVPELPATAVVPELPATTVPVFSADTTVVVRAVIDPRRELLSVKTNLLFYGIYMPGYDRWCPIPNVAIEYYPTRGHFTFGASFDMPWWQDYQAHKYFQLRNYQLETRYYLRSGSILDNPPGEGPAFRGFYLQAYAHTGLFGICFDANRGWVGEGGGAGLGLGYVMPLSKKGHWRLEFGLQGGFFRCKYDPYKYENPVNPSFHDDLYYYKWTQKPELFKKRQYRFNWLGPTRIGVTLTYDLIYRRNHKSGMSFKSTEKRTILETLPQPLPAREGSIYINSKK